MEKSSISANVRERWQLKFNSKLWRDVTCSPLGPELHTDAQPGRESTETWQHQHKHKQINDECRSNMNKGSDHRSESTAACLSCLLIVVGSGDLAVTYARETKA